MKDPLHPNNGYLKKLYKPEIQRIKTEGKLNVSIPPLVVCLAIGIFSVVVVSHLLTALFALARAAFFLAIIGLGLLAVFKSKKS